MNDPVTSKDPVIQQVTGKRSSLLAEARRLNNALMAYMSRPTIASKPLPTVDALRHYPMTEGSECGCATCVEWNIRRGEFIKAATLVPKSHKWSTCACGWCRFVGRIQLNYLAATNTRDLLIEMSYHATHHSPFGEQVMAWLDQELGDARYTINWRAQEMSRYPLERWMRLCETVLGPIVSGEVFRDSMHITDARIHFGSSLAADGVVSF